MTALEGMDTAFRQGDAALNFSLGVLAWCDLLASAVDGLEPDPAAPSVLAERRLTDAAPDDALLFVLGLLSFERKFRACMQAERARAELHAAPAEARGSGLLDLRR